MGRRIYLCAMFVMLMLLPVSCGKREETPKDTADAKPTDNIHDKWNIFGQSLNRETEQITSLSSYEEHYRFLAEWIDRRMEWLDECYHDERFLTNWTGR